MWREQNCWDFHHKIGFFALNALQKLPNKNGGTFEIDCWCKSRIIFVLFCLLPSTFKNFEQNGIDELFWRDKLKIKLLPSKNCWFYSASINFSQLFSFLSNLKKYFIHICIHMHTYKHQVYIYIYLFIAVVFFFIKFI